MQDLKVHNALLTEHDMRSLCGILTLQVVTQGGVWNTEPSELREMYDDTSNLLWRHCMTVLLTRPDTLRLGGQSKRI